MALDNIPDTTRVVDPHYRQIDSQIRCLNGKLNQRLSQFRSINLESGINSGEVERFEQKKACILEEIWRL